MYLLNAFSPTMLPNGGVVQFTNISLKDAGQIVRAAAWSHSLHTAIGHPGTAEVFQELLKVKVDVNREQIVLPVGGKAVVGSLNSRLPEGKVLNAEELSGVQIRWLFVHHIPSSWMRPEEDDDDE